MRPVLKRLCNVPTGETWARGTTFAPNFGPKTASGTAKMQMQVGQFANGSLLVMGGARASAADTIEHDVFARSEDGGRTFSAPWVDRRLPTATESDLLVASNDTIFVSHDFSLSPVHGANRRNLTISVSQDGTKSWRHVPLLPDHGQEGFSGGSCMAAMPHALGVAYERGSKRFDGDGIWYVRVPHAVLLKSDDDAASPWTAECAAARTALGKSQAFALQAAAVDAVATAVLARASAECRSTATACDYNGTAASCRNEYFFGGRNATMCFHQTIAEWKPYAQLLRAMEAAGNATLGGTGGESLWQNRAVASVDPARPELAALQILGLARPTYAPEACLDVDDLFTLTKDLNAECRQNASNVYCNVGIQRYPDPSVAHKSDDVIGASSRVPYGVPRSRQSTRAQDISEAVGIQGRTSEGHLARADSKPLSVLDFGALGDGNGNGGGTDNTKALQDAIDAAQAQGRSLFVPAGRFMVNSTLVVGCSEAAATCPGCPAPRGCGAGAKRLHPLHLFGEGQFSSVIATVQPLHAVIEFAAAPSVQANAGGTDNHQITDMTVDGGGLNACVNDPPCGQANFSIYASSITRSTFARLNLVNTKVACLSLAYGWM